MFNPLYNFGYNALSKCVSAVSTKINQVSSNFFNRDSYKNLHPTPDSDYSFFQTNEDLLQDDSDIKALGDNETANLLKGWNVLDQIESI